MHICADGTAGYYQNPCHGDSGSALVIYKDYKYYAVGVVSYGPGVCFTGEPTVYVKISAYLPWIKRTTGLHGLSK